METFLEKNEVFYRTDKTGLVISIDQYEFNCVDTKLKQRLRNNNTVNITAGLTYVADFIIEKFCQGMETVSIYDILKVLNLLIDVTYINDKGARKLINNINNERYSKQRNEEIENAFKEKSETIHSWVKENFNNIIDKYFPGETVKEIKNGSGWICYCTEIGNILFEVKPNCVAVRILNGKIDNYIEVQGYFINTTVERLLYDLKNKINSELEEVIAS